ncbi:MAG: gliding motility-associated C-terminal domain-containing protein [Bernardetiaceae bacterium]|nr:gliding motility-associated C-terminal domain-containing protein [Bernardetiaceae bacterium]
MMIKYTLRLLVFSFLAIILLTERAEATHVVGGELEFVDLGGNRYRVGLIKYFDAIDGELGAINANNIIGIFRKSDNAQVARVTVSLRDDRIVPYSQPECATGNFLVRRLYYNADINVNPNDYSDPGGYYMVWERCCRNNAIDNITSPERAGATFYLEFPAMVRNGQRFRNSSPSLFPPVSDYACINRPFTFNFSSTDPDGDQLRYKMSVPLNGFSTFTDPRPEPSPGPYPLVTFVPGIGVANMIPGAPDLSIDSEGILTVTPTQTGLYVFAVTVEEFRNGQKIGEVRRDYQLLVIDCPPADPPIARFKAANADDFYIEGDTIRFAANETPKCGDLFVFDPNPNTVIDAKAIPLNFDAAGILNRTSATLPTGGEAVFQACFPECPLPSGEPFVVDFIVNDNSCPQPLYDTLRVIVLVELPENEPPTIEALLDFDEDRGVYIYPDSVPVGTVVDFTMRSDDPNGDLLNVRYRGVGFDATAFDIAFAPTEGTPILDSEFRWRTRCTDLDDPSEPQEFIFEFIVSDQGVCDQEQRFDTAYVAVVLLPDPNLPPTITTSLPFDEERGEYFDTLVLGETLVFDVIGNDPNNDSIAISGVGVGFNFADYNMEFTNAGGFPILTVPFRWVTPCDLVDQIPLGEPIYLNFTVRDFNPCDNSLSETVRVRLLVLPPDPNNQPPEAYTDLPFDEGEQVYVDTVRVGFVSEFTVFADDVDGDSLSLLAFGVGFNLTDLGMEFEDVSGFPILQSPFRWQTFCEFLDNPTRGGSQDFLIDFVARDYKSCQNSLLDTIRVKIVLLYEPTENRPPTVVADLPFNTAESWYETEAEPDALLRFRVIGNDPDLDPIELSAQGVGFELEDLGMIFPTLVGLPAQTGFFEWRPTCEMLGRNNRDTVYFVDFTVKDLANCADPLSATIRVRIDLRANPGNTPPTLEADLTFDSERNAYVTTVKVFETLEFRLRGDDADLDRIFIDGQGIDFDFEEVGAEFEAVEGLPILETDFRWSPPCDLLGGAFSREFLAEFYIADEANCGRTEGQRIRVFINVEDNETIDDFTPDNVFTPNGDGKNDTFSLPNLPADNCSAQFMKIEIFNRWGTKVFQSTDRNFAWDGGDFPAGSYYYLIEFTGGETYKNWVMLVRARN